MRFTHQPTKRNKRHFACEPLLKQTAVRAFSSQYRGRFSAPAGSPQPAVVRYGNPIPSVDYEGLAAPKFGGGRDQLCSGDTLPCHDRSVVHRVVPRIIGMFRAGRAARSTKDLSRPPKYGGRVISVWSAARAEDAHGTPHQSQISPSIPVYEEKGQNIWIRTRLFRKRNPCSPPSENGSQCNNGTPYTCCQWVFEVSLFPSQVIHRTNVRLGTRRDNLWTRIASRQTLNAQRLTHRTLAWEEQREILNSKPQTLKPKRTWRQFGKTGMTADRSTNPRDKTK